MKTTTMKTTTKLDQDARYTVKGCKGVAFYISGFPELWESYTAWVEDEDGEHEEDTGEGEWVEQDEACGRVLVVMVGDDRTHEVDLEDLAPLAEGEYCGSCGQVGCSWGAC